MIAVRAGGSSVCIPRGVRGMLPYILQLLFTTTTTTLQLAGTAGVRLRRRHARQA